MLCRVGRGLVEGSDVEACVPPESSEVSILSMGKKTTIKDVSQFNMFMNPCISLWGHGRASHRFRASRDYRDILPTSRCPSCVGWPFASHLFKASYAKDMV